MSELDELRAEIITLRARVTVTERVSWLGAEVAALMRPSETLDFVETERATLARIFSARTNDTASLSDDERAQLAEQVDRRFGELVKAVRAAGRID